MCFTYMTNKKTLRQELQKSGHELHPRHINTMTNSPSSILKTFQNLRFNRDFEDVGETCGCQMCHTFFDQGQCNDHNFLDYLFVTREC